MLDSDLQNESRGFIPHDLVWDDEKISRHFDYKRTANPDSYAGSGTWRYIVHFLGKHLNVAGRIILDIGCGSGHLLRHFRDLGGICYGLELSEKSIQDAEKKDTANIRIRKGNAREMPFFMDNQFDIICATDVMEHVLDEEIEGLMREVQRVIKRDGHLIILVPYETTQEFHEAHVICPDCGSIFHVSQHLRRFDEDLIRSFFEKYGFRTTFVQAINSDTLRSPLERWIARFSRNFRGLPTIPPTSRLYAELSPGT